MNQIFKGLMKIANASAEAVMAVYEEEYPSMPETIQKLKKKPKKPKEKK